MNDILSHITIGQESSSPLKENTNNEEVIDVGVEFVYLPLETLNRPFRAKSLLRENFTERGHRV